MVLTDWTSHSLHCLSPLSLSLPFCPFPSLQPLNDSTVDTGGGHLTWDYPPLQ